MVKACTKSIFAYDKRTIEALLFEQTRSGTDGVALAKILSTLLTQFILRHKCTKSPI